MDHPNIIKVYDAFEDESKVYMIMDDMRGGNLFELIIKQGNLSESLTATIAAQLISATKYLQKQGLVLRYMKLDTILFGYEGTYTDLKLCDLMFCNYVDKLHLEKPFLLE